MRAIIILIIAIIAFCAFNDESPRGQDIESHLAQRSY